MSDQPTENQAETPPPVLEDHAPHTISEFIGELSFFGWIRSIWHGLHQPVGTREQKWAKAQLLRASSVLPGLGVPLLGVTIMLLMPVKEPPPMGDQFTVTIDKPQEEPTLETIPEEEKIKPETETMTLPNDLKEFATSADSAPPADDTVTPPNAGAIPDAPFSPQPGAVDTVAMVKSPLIMKGMFANRSPTARGSALAKYGGGGGSGGRGAGGAATEDAVYRALRWLKKTQLPNGTWAGEEPSAMAGFALLCFLAHGETPGSKEFGPTVEKAIRYLITTQGSGKAFSANAYANGIATYAMCEAYAMTKVMEIKESMEKGLQVIIDGQQPGGGFDYGYAKGPRWDTSVCGWQYQAMKSGRLAGAGNEGLEHAIEKAISFLKSSSFNPTSGTFSYAGNGPAPGPGGSWTMTGVGVLCLQLLGHSKSAEVKAGLTSLDTQVFAWVGGKPTPGKEPVKDEKAPKNAVYGWYYVTQAKFQDGGERWTSWNKVFSRELVINQAEDGHWEGGDHGAATYTTTLCCLMLEVYYRYLPTYQTAKDVAPMTSKGDDDVVVEVK